MGSFKFLETEYVEKYETALVKFVETLSFQVFKFVKNQITNANQNILATGLNKILC